MSFATAYRQLLADVRIDVPLLPERRPPPRLARLRAWLRQGSLERRLLDGERVAGDDALAARAWQLTRPRACARLAAALDAVLAEAAASAHESFPREGAAVPVRRRAVGAARDELMRAAARLRDPHPAQARGVAMLRRLLRDGNGPLYLATSGDDELWRSLRRAAIALD